MNTQVITCSEFVDLLHPYLDGELTTQKTQEFETHMASCPTCKALFDEMATIVSNCHILDEGLEIPESYKQGWRNAVRQEAAIAITTPIASYKRNNWIRPLTAVAAAFVVLIGSTFYLNSRGMMPGKDNLGNNSLTLTQSENDAEANRQNLYGSGNMPDAKSKGIDAGEGSNAENFAADEYQMMDGDSSLLAGKVSTEPPVNEAVRTPSDTQTKPQMMRRTANLDLLSVTFDAVKATIDQQIATLGAYLEQTTLSGQQITSPTQTTGRTLSLTIRVPSERLDDFINGIAGVAEVTFRQVRAEDLSKNYTETQLQIDMLKTAHAKIEELIAKAENLTDVSVMMQEALRIQYEIESLSGSLRTWDDQISMSTVYVNLTEVQNVDKAVSENLTLYQRIQLGFEYSMNSLGEFLSDMAVTVAMLVPQLIIFIPILLILFMIIHRIRKTYKSKNKNK